MKKNLPLSVLPALLLVFISSCSHKYYTASAFYKQTANHKLVAILPAEMIFTGTQPKNMTSEQIDSIEEKESLSFQQSLYQSVLRYANSRKYRTRVNFQPALNTIKLLEEGNISIRDSWKKDDKALCDLLGVDAVVRMRIEKQRYMSDLASYGIDAARQIIYNTGIGKKVPVPYVNNKTNDIYASCSVVSQGMNLWNDYYRSASDYNTPPNIIIENITENFGKHFPYKQRR